ncbi:lipid-A-disaccharide synthase [Vaginella massiliensis]|uniref:lipid-A-disaccharide synthase n=1 Tax=Vaginella massiliensis TaxID=1816680 RepID=UPI0008385C4C|nr:lipid-A-disaccharide synthase [Vaginella massiliensis]
MKYYIISGEASGDLHGSNLMKALKQEDAQAEFRFWGGDLMQAEGGTLVKHYKDLAFMGFVEVVMNLKTILGNIKFAKKDIEHYRPNAVILIDYPGFNLRIADFVKSLGIKVYYYISPQIWAWKTSRVHHIKKVVDKMFVILPFEQAFYKKYEMDVDFVGHPLLDALKEKDFTPKNEFLMQYHLHEKPIIALLPGSRNQEIKVKLPIMLSVMDEFPAYQFVIAGAPSQPKAFYESLLQGKAVPVVSNDTYNLLYHADAALVTSGTATLETALLNVPEVVCYKGNRISYEIGKRLIKHIQFISLVNLIMDQEIVKELIQQELNTQNLSIELRKILTEPHRSLMFQQYQDLREKLGGEGASHRTAKAIVQDLQQSLA